MQQQEFITRIVKTESIEWRSSGAIVLRGVEFKGNKPVPVGYLYKEEEILRVFEQSGSVGSELVHLLDRKRKEPHEVPLKINLIALFGKAEEFTYKVAAHNQTITHN